MVEKKWLNINIHDLQGAAQNCNLSGAEDLACTHEAGLEARAHEGLGGQVHHSTQAAPP